MSENSSGDKAADEKAEKVKEQFHGKPRAFSLGSINISTAEINRIILGSEEKNTTDKKSNSGKHGQNNVNTTADDNINQRTKIPGRFDKWETDNRQAGKSQPDDPNYVFKPQNSVARTPPPNHANTEDTNKRHRSPSSQVEENKNKKICEESDWHKDINTSNQGPPLKDTEAQESPTMEKLLTETFCSLDQIQNLANLHMNEQETVKYATNLIHKNLTFLTYKIGQLEQDNLKLQYQLQLNQLVSTNSTAHKEPHNIFPAPRTYATVTQKPLAASNEDKWTTPKAAKKLETMIRIDNISDAKETIKQLKKEISATDTDGGFKNIRHLKSGAIVIESCSETQQEKLKVVLENKNNINIREIQSFNPMFMVTGILKGYSDDEFIGEMVRLNNEIENEFPQNDIIKEIKVVGKKNCRNPSKENWILQARPAIAKWFLKRQTINFDLMKVYIQEHLNLAQCFNCAGFGHVAKYCRESACCHKCGATGHQGKECTSGELKCPNCIKMKYKPEESRHSARDTSCPVYQKRLTNYKNQINYTDNFF